MNTPEDRKRLASQIAKLLALAASTNFPGEASSATAKAEELMRLHNITLGPGKPDQETIEHHRYTPPSFAQGAHWMATIVTVLARYCFCAVLYYQPDNDRAAVSYELIGTIWNLDILEYMLAEIDRQRHRAWLEYRRDGSDSFHKFCYGFAKALEGKVEDRVAARAGEVKANKDKLYLWYRTNVGAVGDNYQAMNAKASSEAGIAAGQGASLHRGGLGGSQRRITDRRNR